MVRYGQMARAGRFKNPPNPPVTPPMVQNLRSRFNVPCLSYSYLLLKFINCLPTYTILFASSVARVSHSLTYHSTFFIFLPESNVPDIAI